MWLGERLSGMGVGVGKGVLGGGGWRWGRNYTGHMQAKADGMKD